MVVVRPQKRAGGREAFVPSWLTTAGEEEGLLAHLIGSIKGSQTHPRIVALRWLCSRISS